MGQISIRDIKKKFTKILKSSNVEPVLEGLFQIPDHKAINSLFSFLYHEDPVIKWNAVTAMGAVVSKLAREDIEAAREVIRRLMWNLNDESGGIGWGSPEAMGEILASQKALAGEYSPILISYTREDGNYQEHELMQRGVLWGIGRLAQARPGCLKDVAPHIIPHLKSRDATVRGLAAWIIGLLGTKEARSRLELLKDDKNEIQVYIDRRLIKCRVKDLAEDALKRLDF
ncbi:DVU0298 family protein [Thermodesulfobacteriota bacterium]